MASPSQDMLKPTWSQELGTCWNQFWFVPSDPSVLGAIRLLTGLVALYLHITFTADLGRFFGPDGFLPLKTTADWYGWFVDTAEPMFHYSYLSYLRTPGQLQVAHWIGMGVLLLFTAGVFTRITSILSLIVVLSYMHRAPMLTSQVEPVLAMLMFYLCLGPAGAAWSVDAAWAARRRKQDLTLRPEQLAEVPKRWGATVVIRLIQIHVCAFYLMSFLAKVSGGVGGNPWLRGDAMWWVIAEPDMPLMSFTWIARYPVLIDLWTFSVLLFELGFPLLVWFKLLRPVMVLLSIPMWITLALATGLTTYAAAMLIGSLAFVDPAQLRSCAACCRGKFARKATA